ncbi:ABC transporter ATP-binding protein [Kitasatospora purpeofusca]|uniref:ABC transporter ATP-binding protein n=1 Tax=Kitasatospora purpeofusca TaxID=67352 RepID=UPI002251E470|nr:ABC transporter ATP-binding protein [Kitasatospora purpeofusca]MCX4687098.1 ABC transporter ATP-binding protein [Kitasatospora purpeofusca]
MNLLVAEELCLSFGTTRALDGVSFAVGPGEVVAVTGASGSGKSTLLHCLAGILAPEGGSVHLGGERIDDLSESGRSVLRRRDFGFVFQLGELIPELSVLENVALPLRLAGASRKEAARLAGEALGRLEVADLAVKRPAQISGGQAQRVAVARALIHRPKVVFADEPTGALDTVNGERVLTALTTAAREQGAAVVVVTHEARVAACADREVVMSNGRVVGTKERV